ncbi:PTS family glucose/glucoside (glc) portercomponent IIA [Weissella oryzae SG25]|uniref:PTS family glucose/glucoside (Glc) portercomponent IIA n=1 Tax=Weissella oryzae (strain DSM 25784 / JCM 18191 / LMG 30913 / SG25) TaxID=1329250 RepID=A0A069CRM8_WEIOS|nr:PTS glucose transporter subunit IIA [Weissella oryzae]GAK30425.1 PTS family glucose/glucoside (glc) portercomponent IIA [Weissella oryzae SG25]
MFGFGKKEEPLAEDENLYTPVTGEVVDLTTVPDPVFAGKMMGDGFAVEPTGSEVVAPVAGRITMIQGHAVGITRFDGLEVLVHMGIDTVSLNGAPFKIKVKDGQVVKGGQVIASADWEQIKIAKLPTTTMVLITNTADHLDQITVNTGQAAGGTIVGKATAK